MRPSERKHGNRRIRPSRRRHAGDDRGVVVVAAGARTVDRHLFAAAAAQRRPRDQAAYQQTPAEDGARFRAYKLNHLDVATAQRQLSQFFAASPGTEIVADAPRNRVLVRGDEEVLRQAGELLAKTGRARRGDRRSPGQTLRRPSGRRCNSSKLIRLTPASQTILDGAGKTSGRATGRSRRGRSAVVAGPGAGARYDPHPDSFRSWPRRPRRKPRRSRTGSSRRQPHSGSNVRTCDSKHRQSAVRQRAAAPNIPLQLQTPAGRRFAGAARAVARATAAGEHRQQRPVADVRNRSGAGRGRDRDGQSDDRATASDRSGQSDRRLATGDHGAR